MSTDLEKTLVIPDCHIPFHHKKNLDLALRAGIEVGCDGIVIMGDFIDNYAFSSHPKTPKRKKDAKWEIAEANKVLDYIDDLGVFVRRKFIKGNHETRTERYLIDHAPEAAGLIDIDAQLFLVERGYQVTQYRENTKIGNFNLTHDVEQVGRDAHYKAYDSYHESVGIAHTHRAGIGVEGNVLGAVKQFAMFGWLGDPDQIDWKHRVKVKRDWAECFGILYRERKTGYTWPVLHPIVNGKVLLEGQLFR